MFWWTEAIENSRTESNPVPPNDLCFKWIASRGRLLCPLGGKKEQETQHHSLNYWQHVLMVCKSSLASKKIQHLCPFQFECVNRNGTDLINSIRADTSGKKTKKQKKERNGGYWRKHIRYIRSCSKWQRLEFRARKVFFELEMLTYMFWYSRLWCQNIIRTISCQNLEHAFHHLQQGSNAAEFRPGCISAKSVLGC